MKRLTATPNELNVEEPVPGKRAPSVPVGAALLVGAGSVLSTALIAIIPPFAAAPDTEYLILPRAAASAMFALACAAFLVLPSLVLTRRRSAAVYPLIALLCGAASSTMLWLINPTILLQRLDVVIGVWLTSALVLLYLAIEGTTNRMWGVDKIRP